MKQIDITKYFYTAESKRGVLILTKTSHTEDGDITIQIDFNNNKMLFNGSEELPCSESDIRSLFLGRRPFYRALMVNQETEDLIRLYNKITGYYYEESPYEINFTLLLNLDKILHLKKELSDDFIIYSFTSSEDINLFNFKSFIKIINFIEEKQYTIDQINRNGFWYYSQEYYKNVLLKEFTPIIDKSPYVNLINKTALIDIIFNHFKDYSDATNYGFSPKQKKEISNYLNFLIYWMAFEELPKWQNRIFGFEIFNILKDYFNACKILKIKPSKTNPVKHILRTESLYVDYLNKEKNIKLLEKYNENFEKFFYENDKFTVIMPKSVEELIQEGEKLNNCIGHGGYDDNIIKGTSIILFVRKKEKINESYAAMEIFYNNNCYTIRQYYTFNNGDPKDDFAKDYYFHILEPLNNNN